MKNEKTVELEIAIVPGSIHNENANEVFNHGGRSGWVDKAHHILTVDERFMQDLLQALSWLTARQETAARKSLSTAGLVEHALRLKNTPLAKKTILTLAENWEQLAI